MSEIVIEHLSKTFTTKDGTVEALKDISLSIESGDIFGIIGMSGAGKKHPGPVHELSGGAFPGAGPHQRKGPQRLFRAGTAAPEKGHRHDFPEL